MTWSEVSCKASWKVSSQLRCQALQETALECRFARCFSLVLDFRLFLFGFPSTNNPVYLGKPILGDMPKYERLFLITWRKKWKQLHSLKRIPGFSTPAIFFLSFNGSLCIPPKQVLKTEANPLKAIPSGRKCPKIAFQSWLYHCASGLAGLAGALP